MQKMSISLFLLFISMLINHILGVNAQWLDQVLGSQSNSNAKYKTLLIDRLLQIVHISGQLCKYTDDA